MGIRIDGASDLINATDGSLTIEGQSINSTGIGTFSGGIKVGSAATIHSTGQFNIGVAHTLFANGNATHSGIVTASSFVGSGANLTGITQTTINNNANNRLITGSGTANTLEGESNLTFTGSILTVTNDSGASEITLVTPTSNDSGVYFNDGSNAGALSYDHSDNSMKFRVNATEKARFDSSGRLLIGHTSSLGEVWNNDGGSLQVAGTSYLNSTVQISRWTNSASCPHFIMGKSRGGAVGTNVVVQDDDTTGLFVFAADDGTDLQNATADIKSQVDGTPGSNDTPGRLIFSTTADGSNGTTERVRIDKNGQLVLSNGSMSTAYGNSICGGTNLELDTTGVIKFRTDTNQKMSVTDNGLCFGTDSAAANALDDYEEGSCTLVLSDTSGNNATSGGTANYTKIGRWVNVWGQVTFGDAAAAIGGNHCAIKGWPFAVGSYSSNDIPVWIWNNGTDIYEDGYASVSTDTGGTVWGLYIHVYNGAPSITGSMMGNNGRLSCAFSYEAT